MKNVLFILGTRPEAIKLYPVIEHFKKSSHFQTLVCSTGQHSTLLSSTLSSLNIDVDISLELMTPNQSLAKITSECIRELDQVVQATKPNILFVQGDTTTAYCGALVGFYNNIEVAHVEAGLRSDNIYSPFPEEANRKMISNLATYHFCPTPKAASNLQRENYVKNIHVVGNTVVDSLRMLTTKSSAVPNKGTQQDIPELDLSKKIVLVTAHRRENFGNPIKNICSALGSIAEDENIQIIYPVHPNPNVKNVVSDLLKKHKNIVLTPPVDYEQFVWLISISALIITDSGGIQEEAASLGVFTLATREETERMELIESGWGALVGSNSETIVSKANHFLSMTEQDKKKLAQSNPFGDGTSSLQILNIIKEATKE